jgi:hypothetical protein
MINNEFEEVFKMLFRLIKNLEKKLNSCTLL